MSKLYKHRAWLPLSKLAATWAPELEFDQDELASLLMKKMFGGEVDNLEPDPELNGSNRGVFVIDPETREVLPVRGRLVLHHLTNNPDHTVAKSSQAFYQRDLVGLTRQATLKLAAALDWPPPSYWQPPSRPTKTATEKTKQVFQALVEECRAREQRMNRTDAYRALKALGAKTSQRHFLSAIWTPLAPEDWQRPGNIAKGRRADPDTIIAALKRCTN